MDGETLKCLIDMIDENDSDTIYKVLIRLHIADEQGQRNRVSTAALFTCH